MSARLPNLHSGTLLAYSVIAFCQFGVIIRRRAANNGEGFTSLRAGQWPSMRSFCMFGVVVHPSYVLTFALQLDAFLFSGPRQESWAGGTWLQCRRLSKWGLLLMSTPPCSWERSLWAWLIARSKFCSNSVACNLAQQLPYELKFDLGQLWYYVWKLTILFGFGWRNEIHYDW
jgi:hypothetical protein